ncbi:MAG TPA: hypothetical protein VIY47_00305 [Ignavibacteriaceae bacterium]
MENSHRLFHGYHGDFRQVIRLIKDPNSDPKTIKTQVEYIEKCIHEAGNRIQEETMRVMERGIQQQALLNQDLALILDALNKRPADSSPKMEP